VSAGAAADTDHGFVHGQAGDVLRQKRNKTRIAITDYKASALTQFIESSKRTLLQVT
jgi:hypothetical protein